LSSAIAKPNAWTFESKPLSSREFPWNSIAIAPTRSSHYLPFPRHGVGNRFAHLPGLCSNNSIFVLLFNRPPFWTVKPKTE
jgi:hypothetical protein